MKELDVQQLIDMNYRVLILLGIGTKMIMDYRKLEAYHDDSADCDWWMKAIQAVVYENKPIPPLPNE